MAAGGRGTTRVIQERLAVDFRAVRGGQILKDDLINLGR